jgi:hypothetical protein
VLGALTVTDDDIDKLTIAEVRAIASRASEALKTLRDLGLAPSSPRITRTVAAPIDLTPQQPFPCAQCGRTGVIQPGEPAQAVECIACGNPLPLNGNGVRMTNKGPIGLTAEERQRRLTLPAFDNEGNPLP